MFFFYVKDVESDEIDRQDILEGSMEISHLDSDNYLGQTISADGKKIQGTLRK